MLSKGWLRPPVVGWRRTGSVLLVVFLTTALAACGGSKHATTAANTASAAPDPPETAVVVRVGTVPITKATYEHWMAIGAATVEMPKPTGPLPKALIYTPPGFSECATELHASSPRATAAQLKTRCSKTYASIQSRILSFLITGHWLRQQAAAEHVSVTSSDVTRRLAEERKREGSAAYSRIVRASHQTVPDLEYAIETRLLSERLERRYIAQHKGLTEQQQVAGFNRTITARWEPATHCDAGYVVKDCQEYRAQ